MKDEMLFASVPSLNLHPTTMNSPLLETPALSIFLFTLNLLHWQCGLRITSNFYQPATKWRGTTRHLVNSPSSVFSPC